MTRRDVVAMLAAAAAWPVAARSQQPTGLVIGYLSSGSRAETAHHIAAFRRGLSETGFVEGRNVTIEHHFADGRYDQLSAMAADLVQRQVGLIYAQAPPAALAAKAATATIPIVFSVGFDPIMAGLVTSLNWPGGNATGVTLLTAPLGQKRLEILLELVPEAKSIGMIVIRRAPIPSPTSGMQRRSRARTAVSCAS